jgi:hypothetical protein
MVPNTSLIEYDGAEHFTDRDTIERDRKKSENLPSPQLRFATNHKVPSRGRIHGKTQLHRLVEDWFAEHGAHQREKPFALFSAIQSG